MKKIYFNRRFERRAVIDMTPLIDLVFLLVAFFMVTSSLGNESSIMVNLPKARQSGKQKTGKYMVTVTKDNEFFINDKEVKKAELPSRFKKWSNENQGLTVIVRGDRKSNYESIVYVIDKLNSAGIPKFVISTVK